MKKGFSLIELLVVFAIIALILGIAIPGFSNYNKAQILKTAAYDLKAVLREAQNSSLQGKKEGGCSQGGHVLIGHYITFIDGETGYSMNVLCDIGLRLDYPVKELKLSSNGTVYVERILAYYPSDVDEKTKATVMFKPVNEGVVFIDGDIENSEFVPALDRLEIVLSNGDSEHAVVISSSGDIYEQKL